MVEGKKRSRRFRRIFVKTPGGKTVLHYEKRKPSKPICGICGEVLRGVAVERKSKLRNMPKSKKRPSRPYAGNLCSKCMREKLKARARL